MIDEPVALQKRRNAQPPHLAKIHRIYSRSEVMALYHVNRNTVTAWINDGLRSADSSNRHFLGQELNRFHENRKQRRRMPCKADELFCVHCKDRHQIDMKAATITGLAGGARVLKLACPATGHTCCKFVAGSRPDYLQALRLDKSFALDLGPDLASAVSGDIEQNPGAFR